MSWTKQTKTTSGVSETGYGEGAWGTSAWGSVSGTSWTKQSDASDTWTLRDLLYDSINYYDTPTPYNSGFTIDTWTKVADAS
jgi:hypothetical protein